MSLIRSHILVCTGTGCTSSESPKIIAEFEKQLAAQGMDKEAQVVRTGCFGLCALGPIVTIYPEGACYTHVTVDDVEEIVAEHIVKGRIVRFTEGYRQAAKLKTLMGARSEAQQQDFRDICEKNDFTVDDFRDQWIDFPEFLSYLPTLRSQSYDSVLATAAVQEMRDSHAHYYFQIDAVLREGEPIPLERLRGTIRRILFNQRKGEIIRAHEEELCARAAEMGEVKIFADEKPKKDE